MESAHSDPRLTVLHADMDAFYAAIEVLDDPSLRGKPVIIGHPGRRGVVSTASYEARRFGVHSALPSVIALRRCPDAVWRSPRIRRYAQVSREGLEVFRRYTPIVEPLSLDEAFLDVGGSLRLFGGAVAIAEDLRRAVREATGGLTVSVGVAENKFLAKLASDLEKPDGLTVVHPGRAKEFLAPLEIQRLWGVGPKTAAILESSGFHRIGDLAGAGRSLLQKRLGKALGAHVWELAHGRDLREVESGHGTKSISTESWGPGRGQHGSMSKHEMNNVMFAWGPGFKQGITLDVPSGNIDVAPTILNLLGLPGGDAMDGRVLAEALNGGPEPDTVDWSAELYSTERRLKEKMYRQQIKLSVVVDTTYVDQGNSTLGWR